MLSKSLKFNRMKRIKKLISLVFIVHIKLTIALLEIQIYDELVLCSKTSPEVCDISEFEIYTDEETKEIYLNGTATFVTSNVDPWDIYVFSERYDRGKWFVTGLNRNISDFCSLMHDPSQPWYIYMKDQPPCPVTPGVRSNPK